MQQHTRKKIMRTLGVAVFVIGVFVLGAYTGTHDSVIHFFNTQEKASAQTNTSDGKDLSQFWNVWQILQQQYPFAKQEPTEKNKIYGAISGLVASYKDPYTIFFPPKEASLFNDQVRGSFGGVGMEVGMKNGLITVIAPLKDSPAQHAGVLAGDVIIEINSQKTDTMDIETAISLIRGEKGTAVKLKLLREGEPELISLSITRDTISLPVIDTKIEGDVFIISLYTFSEKSAILFQGALDKFVASGKKKLIIDLRNNPGGYLDSSVDIASFFLPKGKTIVTEDTGNEATKVIYVSRGYKLSSTPESIIVLINNGSASASEILAGALMEQGVAKTLGTQSFGKGSVQRLIDLPDKSSLKITVAKWLTPKGNSISDKGITPTVVVDTKPVQDPVTKKWSDPQLDAALKLLK